MSDLGNKVNFNIPSDITKRKNLSILSYITLALVLIILILIILTFLFPMFNTKSYSSVSISSDTAKKISDKLDKLGMKKVSADYLMKYVQSTDLSSKEKAKAYYQIGKLFQDGRDFEKALEFYFLSQETYELSELSKDINFQVGECLQKLGNQKGYEAIVTERTSLNKDEASKDQSEIVAEIGPQKISKADMEQLIQQMIDLQLKQYAMYLSPEQIEEQKKEMLKKFDTQDAKKKFLDEYISTELLMREAIKRQLLQDPNVDKEIENIKRQYLAQKVLDYEIKDNVKISDSDLKDYYDSHVDEFKDKEKLELSMIKVDTKEKCTEVIDKLKKGNSFESLAKEHSTDESTKNEGGKLSTTIAKNEPITGVGSTPEMQAAIFTLDENEYTKEPINVDDKYYIFKLNKKVQEKQKSFNEALPEIKKSKVQQKQQEVLGALMNKLKNEYNVVIHNNKFTADKSQAPADVKK